MSYDNPIHRFLTQPALCKQDKQTLILGTISVKGMFEF